MNSFITIIKYDYLQRTRSYGFLITLCISLAVGYSFVPEPNANYSTIQIGGYIGVYNSAWFGYVTAIMTSVFLSLIGFYLVNSGIKTDVETKVGQIMSTTAIKNLTYLLAKTWSNFLVLLTIACLVFLMSVLLFFLYHDTGYSLEIGQFITPYLLITVPSLFLVSSLALVSEVVFGRFSVLQNISFFFLFGVLMVYALPKTNSGFMLDAFGSKIVTHQMEATVKGIIGSNENMGLNIGYVIGNSEENKRFEFNGVNFPTLFIVSRILWSLLGLLLVVSITPFFHRFDFRKSLSLKNPKAIEVPPKTTNSLTLSNLPTTQIDYGVLTLLKTEFLLLIRNGKKWMWFLNLMGMAFLGFLSMEIAHQLVLPILWFLQVSRLSELTSKEFSNEVHYFSFSSYRPITRLLFSQILAASLLLMVLATPLLIRFAFAGDFIAMTSVILGAIGIVLFAAVLGMLSKGKKLFEVLFFMISYAYINAIPFLDYFGGMNHDLPYVLKMSFIVLGLSTIGLLTRKYQLRQ